MSDPLEDLAARWRHARRSALRAGLPGSTSAESEEDLLSRALASSAEDAQKRAFDNSLRLGVGFARYFDKEFTLGELPDVLAALGAPCLVGEWRPASDGEPALFLERKGCPSASLGPSACDFWREAIDGLVLGITGGIRHSRHESKGHDDARCLDVVHVRPESPLRFGAIPSDVRAGLEGARRMARAFDSTVDVEFLGISQGTLFYQLNKAGCGGELSVKSLVEREVRRRFPRLDLREISPRSVLTGDA